MEKTINSNPVGGIYKVTSPSGKIYIGQEIIKIDLKSIFITNVPHK